jgi:bifunctional DNA-binding transcriptional regulator/antitoxin component of YhaV-PrlF toxin-antitoxin module
MDLETTHMSENGRIVLPVAIRRAANIRPREVLTVRVDDEGIHLQTRRQAIKRAQTIVRSYTKGRKGLVDEFLRERRDEAARE